jgi:hypothetical protein
MARAAMIPFSDLVEMIPLLVAPEMIPSMVVSGLINLLAEVATIL